MTELLAREELMDLKNYLRREDIAAKVFDLRVQGRAIVFTNGCFDILHIGHVRYLKDARAIGGQNAVLIVGINSDDSVRELKGDPRPFVPECERAEVIGSLKPVDYVTVFDELTTIELIKIIRPDFYVKGGDYTPEQPPETPTVKACGGQIVIVGLTRERSTTNMVTRIKDSGDSNGS